MKIITLKLNIKTLLLFLLLTHSLLAQQKAIGRKDRIHTTKEFSERSSLAPNATITGNFSICLPGPNTTQLTGSGIPDATTPWTSLNPAVATIDNAGLVTAVSFGATTISYKDNLGNIVSVNVYVSTFPTITSPSGSFTTCEAGTLQLNGSIFPNAITPWESMNTGIATVDNTGLVTGVAGGVVNILYRNLGGCTVLQPITINPLLSPTIVCGATTFNQITFNWGAVPGASTYTIAYTVNGGAFQLGGFGAATTYTQSGLLPGDYVDIYVTPSGPVGTCFTNGTVRCYTTACTPATSPLTPTVTTTQPTCSLATGTITITAVAGETYSFDGGTYSATLIYSGLAAGSAHTVTAKNAVGCISPVANIVLNAQPATPAAPILTPTQPTCTVATGCVTITATAGETYSFDGSAYSATLVYCGLAAGSSHNVTAKNAAGCISPVANIVLNAQPPTPAAPTLTPTQPTCTVATGCVTITAVAGETYSFDGSAYSATLIYCGLAAGSSHNVTSKNASGCISTIANIVLNAQPATPAAPTLTPTQPTCAVATGCVTITAVAGETYSFDGSAYSATLVYCGLAAGSSHNVTAQNAAGCISPIANIVLNVQPATPAAPTLTPTQPTCTVATGCVTITSTAGETYSFDGSAYSATLVYCGLAAGSSHNVTAKNAAGCISAIANIVLNAQPPTPAAPTLTPTQPTCTVATGCVTITAVAGETYSFDGSAYSATLIYCGLPAGSSHNVTAKNASGCISTIANIVLNAQPATPAAPTLTPTQPTCTVATGCVTITAVAGETYSFDGSAYSATLIYCGLAAGSSHNVTTQNAAGCISAIANIVLNTQPATPAAPTLTPTQPTCTVATGCVTITATAGETYSFDGSAYSATLVYCGLTDGSSHNVTAKNAAGCISSIANIVLNVQPPTPAAPTLTPTEPTCTVATGCVTITAVAGETYSFDGSPYSATLVYCGLAAGSSHNVTAKNASGCISAIANIVLISQPISPLAPTLTPTHPSCTLATGTITITGVAGETYSFDGNLYSGTLVYSGLAAGSSHNVTAQNAGGCISPIANVVLNAQPTSPVAPISTGNITECELSPIQTLDANNAITPIPGITISWYDAAVLGNSVGSPTLNTVGTITYYAEANDGTCPSFTRTAVTLTINPAPTAPISTGNITECEISPIQTLNANAAITPIPGINIIWYDAAVLGNTVGSPTLNTVGTITYYAEANDGTCPSYSRTAVTLTINPAPTAPISTGNITECELSPIQTLDANNAISPIPGITISWYDAAVLGNLVGSPTLNTVGTVTYYAQANDGTCDSLTRTAVTLTINPAPTAPISTGNITQCEISPIQTLNANAAITPIPGINIIWYDAAVLGNTVGSPTLNTVGTITYYAEANDGTCPSYSRTAVTLTINPAPTAPISTGNITECELSPIQTLDANNAISPIPGITISWYDAAVLGNLVGSPTRNTVGTVTYYAQANDGTCPSYSRTAVTLKINPAPAAPISTGNITECELSPIQTLNAINAITPTPGQTITWYDAATLGNVIVSPTLNTVGTITYYPESNDGTCPSLTRTAVTLTINPAPTAPVSNGNITQCEQSPIQTLNAVSAITPIPGQNVSWYTTATLGTAVATPTLNTVGTIIYYGESNDGTCPSYSRTAITLTINPAPAAPISTGNIIECEWSPIQTLNANNAITPISGHTVTWYTAATLGSVIASPTLNTVGTITVFGEDNDGTCPSLTRTAVTLTINPAPTAPISNGNITQCQQSPIQTLNANAAITPIPGINITWYDAAVLGNSVGSPTLNTVGTITYYAESNDGTCPSYSRTAVTLTINPAPSAAISTGNITECELSPIQTLDANNAIPTISGITLAWYATATLGISVPSPIKNTTGSITYYAQTNDGTCNSLTRTAVTLTINPAPAAPISTGNITQCQISPIQTLNANNAITPIPGINITWFDVLGNSIAIPKLNAIGSITYYAQANDGTCSSFNRTAVTLTINPAPAAPITGGDIFECVLPTIQTITATATVPAGQTIAWYDAPIAGNIISPPSINTAISVIYYAQANDGTCNSLTRTPVILTINPLPVTPTIGLVTQPDCFTATGSVTIFPVQAGVTYSLDSGPFTNTAFYDLLSAGTTHTLIAKNAGGCLSPTALVNIITQPTTPIRPILVATQPTCTDPTGSISISGVSGEVYSFDGGPYTNTLTYTGLIASSTHTVKAKNTSGCISPIATLTLNVQPLTPSAPTLTPIQPTCTVATGSVLISGVVGEAYSFDGGAFTNSLTYANLTDGSTHNVRAINGSGCISTATTITLDIQPPTPAAPSFITTQPSCTSAVGEFIILNVAGETYSFDGSTYSNTLLYSNVAPGTYPLTAQNGFGCISAIANVIINPQPITATPAITDGVICVDLITGIPFQTYTLDTRMDAATHTFVWALDGVFTSDSGSSVIATQPGIYTVVATNIATGCPSPTATASVTESFPGLGITTLVEGQFSNDTSIIATVNTGTGPFYYQLDHGPMQESNVFASVAPGTHTIIVRDANGCTYLTTDVIVLGYMNYFTPNNDGYNDAWNVIGLKTQPSAKIHIFDRYGKYIKQISPADEGWDGTFNDQAMPSTDYWFTAEYTENGQQKEFKSHFSLVR
ncbi:T9SS type B sorting domain-containing protein [Flavobacterium sp.]|uniref:Ig-like domain-containing protein n=1 Tax=Flavobacterium sp. TaxID=239 RepID=UPI00286ADE2A|nr:T9SS type B sorting domain-containing protein [Flavobacterium sp.]